MADSVGNAPTLQDLESCVLLLNYESMALAYGIEPQLEGSKPPVLPLDEARIWSGKWDLNP